jgi:ribosomal protein S18 acetylase RimI-like enzyme
VKRLMVREYCKKDIEALINLLKLDNELFWNKTAINLYESLGFEVYQTMEHKRLIL